MSEGLYHCVVCGRALPIIDDVIVHDDVPHPESMDFAEVNGKYSLAR